MYAITIMLLGASIFGYIVGSVGALATDANGGSSRSREKLASVREYLIDREATTATLRRVKRHFEFLLEHHTPFDEEGILSCLPLTLSHALTSFINAKTMPEIPIFAYFHCNRAANIVFKSLTTGLYVKGHVLLRQGDLGMDIHFIVTGGAQLIDHKRQRILANAGPRNFVGHDALLTNKPHAYSAHIMTGTATAYSLSFRAIESLRKAFPDIGEQLSTALAKAIQEQTIASDLFTRAAEQSVARADNRGSTTSRESWTASLMTTQKHATFEHDEPGSGGGISGGSKVLPVAAPPSQPAEEQQS